MSARVLVFVAFAFAVAAFVASVNGSTVEDRIADSLTVLPAVLLICTASIVRSIDKRARS